jgi:hypothetical protein
VESLELSQPDHEEIKEGGKSSNAVAMYYNDDATDMMAGLGITG